MEKVLSDGPITIVFDNIVFSLQESGGVSGVWKELISRTIKKNEFECYFFEYQKANDNINRKEIFISDKSLQRVGRFPLILERFLNPSFSINRNFIFHSSYYRICSSRNAINVTTVHDFIHEKFRSGIPLFINHLQKKIALHKSDAIICISEFTKKDLLSYFPTIDEKKIYVVYNGVNPSVFRKLTIQKPISLNRLGNYVLYVGNRKQKYKNFISLVTALKSHPDLNLVIVGGGIPSAKELNHLNNELNGRLIFLKNIDNQNLNILYNFAFALIYPSIYEGFGMPVIEAQSAGCPVIATNCSSITEIAQDSVILTDNGTSTELAKSIQFLKNKDVRELYITKGLSNSLKFSWDKMANQVANIYATILNIK